MITLLLKHPFVYLGNENCVIFISNFVPKSKIKSLSDAFELWTHALVPISKLFRGANRSSAPQFLCVGKDYMLSGALQKVCSNFRISAIGLIRARMSSTDKLLDL